MAMDTTLTRRRVGEAETGIQTEAAAVFTTAEAQRRVRRASQRAFSLIEVMIVIAIILAISGLVALTLFSRRDQAESDLGRVEFRQIEQALKFFRLDFNRYPTDEEGLAVLWDKERLDPEADQNAWKGYLEAAMPTDRWGNDWRYRQQSEETDDTTKYDLWSFGADGEEGTEDDIESWDLGTDEEEDSGLPPPSGG
jgi:general secretion pathway protein G